MDRNYIKMILKSGNLTAMQYKIIFTLMLNEYTKAQLAEELNVSQQSINPVANNLLELGLIKIARTEGRNQYLVCNSDLIVRENKKFTRELDEAQDLYEEYLTLSSEEIEELDSEKSSKYGDAIFLIYKQMLWDEGSLLYFDQEFERFAEENEDTLASDISYIRDNLNGNAVTWQYSIGGDMYITVEYTFINKDITSDYISKLIEEHSRQYAYEEIVYEKVKVTKMSL